MSVRATNDPAEFAATVFPFLAKDPVLNTITISNVAERAAGGSVVGAVMTSAESGTCS
jgi:hypothetical protein